MSLFNAASPGRVVAVLGAESTGKTILCAQLSAHLREHTGQPWQVVNEFLREWCTHAGRTPRAHEQLTIAAEQTRRIARARTLGPVVADTTALQTAVYSQVCLGDYSLLQKGLEMQASYNLTLILDCDLPWVADGIFRDGPAAQTAADTALRAACAGLAGGFTVVGGQGPARLAAAAGVVLGDF